MSALPGDGRPPLTDPPACVFVDPTEIARLRELSLSLVNASRAVNSALGQGALTTASFSAAKAGCARAVKAASDLNAELSAR